MKQPARPVSGLKVVNGGLNAAMSFGNLRIVSAPENSAPFKVNAMTYEEDTYLIMSAKPETAPLDIHPLKLMAELMKLTPEIPGSVLVAGKNPVKFLAVIHDVDQDPTWREEWIEKSLESMFKEAEQRKIPAIGLPILGAKHGKIKLSQFAKLLARALLQTRLEFLNRLWLIAGVPDNSRLIDMLKSELIPTQEMR
jgi:hypothetical protein